MCVLRRKDGCFQARSARSLRNRGRRHQPDGVAILEADERHEATRLNRGKRLGLALVGGMIAGLGARIALGCTSGLGLSGSATLATAGFLFLIGFFATGAAFGLIMKRYYV